MLAKMGELLQSCASLEEVFAAALGFAPRIFPVARGAMALLNASRNLAEVIGSWADCQLPVMEFEPTECWALRTGHPHLVSAGDLTAPCAHAAGVKHMYLCIPILAQGETLGILHLQATDEAPHSIRRRSRSRQLLRHKLDCRLPIYDCGRHCEPSPCEML